MFWAVSSPLSRSMKSAGPDVAAGLPQGVGEAVAEVALSHRGVPVHEPEGGGGDHPVLQSDPPAHVHMLGQPGGELAVVHPVDLVDEPVAGAGYPAAGGDPL